MEDIRKSHKFLNFWFSEEVEIPIRGRGEETRDKAIFKSGQIDEETENREE